uniref:Interferon gamma induced GTPase n=1 Tax=Cricetulus griseus TaxID=10029 RepID=A0A8C2MA94_CRIGR
MDSVMTWPSKVWKGFSFFINMINSFISPSSESITASESSYTNQILYSQEVNEKIGSLDMRRRIQLPLGW